MKLLLLALLILVVLAWIGRGKRVTLSLREARETLDLPAGADAQMVRSAHRRLLARVHPDAGGSAALARRATAARDVLLADLSKRSPR